MGSWSYFYNKLLELRYNRAVEKAREETETVADGFWELYQFATTYHGRRQLSKVILAADRGGIEVAPKVLSLYKYLLITSPHQDHSVLN